MTTADTAVVADDYAPGRGDLRFGVERYDLDLRYRVAGNRLDATATLLCHNESEQPLAEVVLDLHGLRVSRVTVDGAAPRRYTHRGGRLVIRPRTAVAAGAEFEVVVRYAGQPGPVRSVEGELGWEELEDGVIVASQPDGASSWFPCNDRPSDKASYRISVTTTNGYTVVCNGILLGHRPGASSTTWVYEQAEPMATYLATVQIGRYAVESLAESPVPVRAAYPPARSAQVRRTLARQGDMLHEFTRLFGPYPFGAYAVVVTDDPLEIPLEAQSVSIFGSNLCRTDWGAQRLVAHELAHQWFGNSLTALHWRDIWLHEGFACYSEWLWSEASGGRTAQMHAREQWTRLSRLPQDILLGDPGRADMFDDRVYKRGALLLHAIRLTVGEATFVAVLRTWTARFAHSGVTTADFVTVANEVSGRDLGPLFDDWLHRHALPPLPEPSRSPRR